MKKTLKAVRAMEILDELYPDPPIPLDHRDPFTLLVAVLLSAQTTDARVNMVTPGLFKKAATPQKMAKLSVETVLEQIRTCGLAPGKAKNIVALSKILVEQHGGKVPRSLEEMEELPGVGHKTASVVMTQAFGQPAFPVDTHIHRLAERWGLSSGKNVEQTERDLKGLFPEDRWADMHLKMIYFGRELCPALRHDLGECAICSWAATKKRIREEKARSAPTKKKVAAKRSRRKPRAKAAQDASRTKSTGRWRPRSASR